MAGFNQRVKIWHRGKEIELGGSQVVKINICCELALQVHALAGSHYASLLN